MVGRATGRLGSGKADGDASAEAPSPGGCVVRSGMLMCLWAMPCIVVRLRREDYAVQRCTWWIVDVNCRPPCS